MNISFSDTELSGNLVTLVPVRLDISAATRGSFAAIAIISVHESRHSTTKLNSPATDHKVR